MGRKLTINISNYVKRLKNIDFLQPLYEAIVNSLDANATQIKIKFDVDVDYFVSNQPEIEECYNLTPVIRVLRDNADLLNAFFIDIVN